MKHTILFLFGLLLSLFSAHAYHFRSYQVEDGLSHNSVWAVMQDSKGFMWFGTNDGLNRFDGKKIKVYRKIQGDSLSIGNNFIHCLKEDSRGRFLIGTKQGLYLFDEKLEKFRHINLDKDMKDDVSINAIMEDPSGNIWLACHGYGLYVLTPELITKKHYVFSSKPHSLPSNYIWSIAQDYYGNIWLGTVGKGLVHFDPKEEKFSQMAQIEELGIDDPVIYSLYCDIDNNIWVGTATNGLIRYTPKAQKATHYMNNIFNIKSIIEYSDHELIMGSDKGLVKFDRTLESFDLINDDSSFDNMTDNSIFSIARDKEGSFWIGTYFGGVNYYSPAINRFQYCYNSPNNSSKKNIISGFAENENGDIWIGTHNDGLYLFNPKNLSFKKPYNIGYHDVQSILSDQDKLYASLYGKGINILNVKNGQIVTSADNIGINHTINSIAKTSKGQILFTSEGGVIAMDASGNLKSLDFLTNTPVKDIAEDYDGSIWFATHSKGLIRLTSDNKWEVFTNNPDNPKSLPGNNINCVFQDSKFHIWAGTEGEGLVRFNAKEQNFEPILNDKSGLPSNIIYSILDDSDGNLWVSTGGGLVKISSDLKTIKTFAYIGDIQRIQYNLNCALRASDNRLYFGGTNGFITFNPKEITDNPNQPAIMVTGFQIASKEITLSDSSPLKESINITKKITLLHDQSTFSFDFVALSYLSPEQNRYAYILEGFDKEWHYTYDNKAIYMNIPPGTYVFRVKGTNNDGIWSDETADITIQIKPPFWLSNIMICLYITFVIGSILYFIRRYHRFIERKNQEKIFKYQTAKEKEMYESKINFFTNIAHEIRTPLSLIAAPLEKIILSGDGNEQTKNHLKMIERNANRLLELINQLLDFRKIEEDMFHFNFKRQNVIKILEKVYKQYYQSAKFNKLEISLEAEKDDIECNVDSEAIYKIISNLIANAIKYAKSQILITAKETNGNLQISIKDDGTGIENQYMEKIFEPFFQIQSKDNAVRTGSGLGLSLSQSLAMKHNGKISIESEYGKNCSFTLTIPVADGAKEDVQETEALTPDKSDIPEQLAIESGTKIIIVEDNTDMRTFLCESLNDNYIIFEAENGVQALEVIEKENIDIIISDIMMPEMDGLELCNRLKSDPAYSHLPLVLLSAKTDTSTKIEGLNQGADVYMEKPFSIEQLKAQVNSIIENRNNLRKNFIKSPLQYFKQNTENNESADFVKKLNTIILENMSDEDFSIDSLSSQFAISRSNLHKKIKNITGMTPNDYIKLIRLNESARMLSTGKYKINEVCFLVGFNTPSYFSKCFFEQFKKLPKDFIQITNE